MKKLKLKHLLPYLPYELNVQDDEGNTRELKGLLITECFLDYNGYGTDKTELDFSEIKPILIPMSKLKPKLIEEFENYHSHKEYDKDVIDYFCEEMGVDADEVDNMKPEFFNYGTMQWLFKNHYDVFDLIESDLAIEKV